MSNIEVILISQVALPYKKIASWTSMYNYLLLTGSHHFDHIICPEDGLKTKDISYTHLRNISSMDKIKNKLIDKKSRYNNYIQALDKIIIKDKKYIIHVIDNSGILIPIDNHLKDKYNRKDFYIQYCYHGFAPIFPDKKDDLHLLALDEIVFLTNLSYKAYLNYYTDFTLKARVVHNAVDSNKFHLISKEQKHRYRKTHHINEKTVVFLWCSQDRPKKGLHIALEAFATIHEKNKHTLLLVVGISRQVNQDGVRVVGRVPNTELPIYYQMADVFLFPSLWKEGFGMVLSEALKCGCYCIASDQGGIAEVLNHGEYGVLIDNPNFIDNWVAEMEKAIELLMTNNANPFLKNLPEKIYDINNWINNINQSILDAKHSF